MESLTLHHLVPRQQTKRKKMEISSTVTICSACHRQIHSLFNNKQLAQELNTLEKLKNEPQLQKFIAWVRKQTPNKKIAVRRSLG
jgi:5-methylcytosine-specific restriction endonuclease McrA